MGSTDVTRKRVTKISRHWMGAMKTGAFWKGRDRQGWDGTRTSSTIECDALMAFRAASKNRDFICRLKGTTPPR